MLPIPIFFTCSKATLSFRRMTDTRQQMSLSNSGSNCSLAVCLASAIVLRRVHIVVNTCSSAVRLGTAGDDACDDGKLT